jgi:hypothetical protein
MNNPNSVLQDNLTLLEHGKQMEREIKLEQQEKMLNQPNLRSQMKSQLKEFRNANFKNQNANFLPQQQQQQQQQPPPNIFSQQYTSYNNVKPQAVPSARIRLGGVF